MAADEPGGGRSRGPRSSKRTPGISTDTWQVAPIQLAEVSIAQHHPYVSVDEEGDVVDAEIFARFLEEELGWEEFICAPPSRDT